MEGPEGAGARTAEWVAARVPARLRLLEARLGLPAASLADPAKVLDHEEGPIALEDWPAIYVLPQTMTGMGLVDVTATGGELWRVTYPVRIVGWVRGDGYADTDTLRKRYALAIRETLLERKTLTTADAYAADGSPITVDPGSLRESYSEVFTDKARRTIAGVIVDVNVLVLEELDGPTARGTVQATDVTPTPMPPPSDTAAVPPHPAL